MIAKLHEKVSGIIFRENANQIEELRSSVDQKACSLVKYNFTVLKK